MKSVLYITYDGLTDPLGQSQVIPYLLGLSSRGYRITILSCEKKERYNKNRETIINTLKGSIQWEPIFYTKKPPILSTIYDFSRLKKAAIKLHKKNNFLIVHCRSYIPSLVGHYLKKKSAVKFIFDMRGFWADERVDGGLWNLQNPIFKIVYQFFKRKEALFLNTAEVIVSLTEKGKDEMLKWGLSGLKEDKIHVIPCCVDTQLFDPDKVSSVDRIRLRKEIVGSDDSFLLGYLGSIGTWYMLNEMLDFFVVLKRVKPQAKFIFITYDEHELIKEAALLRKLDQSDIIISPGNRSEIPQKIAILDWSIFFIKPTYSKMSSSPTKQGEIMSMGVPVICNSGVGDVDEITNNYRSGILVKEWNYEKAIKEMFEQPFNQYQISLGANEYFSLEQGVNKYFNIYNSLI